MNDARTEDEFMKKFRGVASHKIARAVTNLTSPVGVIYTGCPKGWMAKRWAEGGDKHNAIGKFSLEQIEHELKEIYAADSKSTAAR